MHPRILCLVLGALAAFAATAAVVYRWVDGDGVVHYSDQPVPGAEKIFTSSSGKSLTPPPLAAGNPVAKKPAASLNFEQIAIISPAEGQTFFGDEAIEADLALAPDLGPNQTVNWQLNGKQLAEQHTVSFVLPHLDRGAYAIAATVTDQITGEWQSAPSITFYVRQPSALSPQHKNP